MLCLGTRNISRVTRRRRVEGDYLQTVIEVSQVPGSEAIIKAHPEYPQGPLSFCLFSARTRFVSVQVSVVPLNLALVARLRVPPLKHRKHPSIHVGRDRACCTHKWWAWEEVGSRSNHGRQDAISIIHGKSIFHSTQNSESIVRNRRHPPVDLGPK